MTENYEQFFYFGSAMLAIFGILYSLVLLANGLDMVIVGENWNPINNFRIEILLLPLAIPGLTLLIKAKNSSSLKLIDLQNQHLLRDLIGHS